MSNKNGLEFFHFAQLLKYEKNMLNVYYLIMVYIYIYVIYIYTYIYTYIYIHTYISSIMITFKQFCIDLYKLYLNVENFLPAFFMLFVDLLLKAALHHHLTAST